MLGLAPRVALPGCGNHKHICGLLESFQGPGKAAEVCTALVQLLLMLCCLRLLEYTLPGLKSLRVCCAHYCGVCKRGRGC